jgi:hypothetical protein
MKLLQCVALLYLVLHGMAAVAQASYDSEKNEVVIKTPLFGGSDTGFITIKADDHISIFAIGSDPHTKKLMQLCGREPTLGLLLLDGKLIIDRRPPKVTETTPFGEKSTESNAAGYVHSYILKGEPAKDLIDLLMTHDQVGFGIVANKCDETSKLSSRGPTINFITRGLERAMKRLK